MTNKYILLLSTIVIFTSLTLYAKDIEPTFILKSKGFVNDFVFDEGKLYVANDEGSVEVFDLSTQELVDEIFIDPIYTTKLEWQNSRILSVDRRAGKTLLVSNAKGPFRNVWLHDGKTLKHIIKVADKMPIKEARFITDNKFLFGTLGYEMILYTASDSYNSYTSHLEQSSFSDLELSEDKKTMVTASESGRVIVSDVKTGQMIKKLPVLNLDKVYQLSYRNGNIITGGEDRKVGVYPKDGKPYFIKSEFLVYSVGLTPSGKIGVYSCDEHSTLQLFDVETGEKKDKLFGLYAIPTTLKFYDEHGLFSAGYENKIFYWRID